MSYISMRKLYVYRQVFFLETSIVFYKKKVSRYFNILDFCYIIMLLSFSYMLVLSLGPTSVDWDMLALGTIGETELSLTDDLQFWTPIFGAGTPIFWRRLYSFVLWDSHFLAKRALGLLFSKSQWELWGKDFCLKDGNKG